MLLSGCDVHECRVLLLGNPDGVALDSNARSMSSGGGVPTPCTRRRSPLRHAGISLPKFCLVRHVRILWSDISHLDISQPDGRGGYLNFPCQTCPDPLIALTRRVFLSVYSVAVFSWSFLIFSTDILRYFALDIWCLNPQTVLVTHLS